MREKGGRGGIVRAKGGRGWKSERRGIDVCLDHDVDELAEAPHGPVLAGELEPSLRRRGAQGGPPAATGWFGWFGWFGWLQRGGPTAAPAEEAAGVEGWG